jgi:hypothetical protein
VTLADFMNFLRGPGINAAIGVILSFVVEWYPQWPNVASRTKRIIMLLLSLIIPLLATAGLCLLGLLPANDSETWWTAILAGATAFSAGQLAYIRNIPSGNTRYLKQ